MRYTTLVRMLVLGMLTTTLFAADDPREGLRLEMPPAAIATTGDGEFSYLQRVATKDGYQLVVDPALIEDLSVLADSDVIAAQRVLLASKKLLVVRHLGSDGQYVEMFLHNRIGNIFSGLKPLRYADESKAEESIRRVQYQEGGLIPSRENVLQLFDAAARRCAVPGESHLPFTPTRAAEVAAFAQRLGVSPRVAIHAAVDVMSPPPARSAPVAAPTPPAVGSYTVTGHHMSASGVHMVASRGKVHSFESFPGGGYELVWTDSDCRSIAEVLEQSSKIFGPQVVDAVSLVVDVNPLGSAGLAGLELFKGLKKFSARNCDLRQVANGTLRQPLESLDLSDNHLIIFDLRSFADDATVDDIDDEGEDVSTPVVQFLQNLCLANNKLGDVPLNLNRAINLTHINLLSNPISKVTGESFPLELTKLGKISFGVSRLSVQELIARGALGSLFVRQMWQLIAGAQQVWTENEWLQTDFPQLERGEDSSPRSVESRFFGDKAVSILDKYIRHYVESSTADAMYVAPEMRRRLANGLPLSAREIADFFTHHGNVLQGVLDNNTRVTITLDGVKNADAPLLEEFLKKDASGCVVIYH